VLLATPLFVACSSSSPQAAEPPPLSSLLATPSPTPTPVAGSVVTAAVQAYVNGLNKAFRTGNIDDAEAASSADCKCRDQLHAIANVYAHHARFVDTHMLVVRIALTERKPTTAQARVTVRLPASSIVLPNGKHKPVKGVPAHPVTVTLVEKSGHWVVSSFEGLPRPEVTASATPSPHG
jgi:hypothetical protein